MKKINLSNESVSVFCMEMSLLLHSGISIGDGLRLLADDETEITLKSLLKELADKVNDGNTLSSALRETEYFPKYVADMTETGEISGRQEQAFQSLSEYYDGRFKLMNRIKSAILYPVILSVLMLIIIAILLVKVLPIFNKVYEQLGGEMKGIAGGLLQIGLFLGNIMPVIGVLLAIILIGFFIFAFNHNMRGKAMKLYHKYFGSRGLVKKVGTAHFVSAMSMGIMSGLNVEDALRNAAVIQDDVPAEKRRHDMCIQKLESGMGLAQAMRETQILSNSYCRMLELGIRCGSADTVITEIARRLQEEAEQKIEEKVGLIEPTIVVITSFIVGTILLSVMLPLMNIMSSIG